MESGSFFSNAKRDRLYYMRKKEYLHCADIRHRNLNNNVHNKQKGISLDKK